MHSPENNSCIRVSFSVLALKSTVITLKPESCTCGSACVLTDKVLKGNMTSGKSAAGNLFIISGREVSV